MEYSLTPQIIYDQTAGGADVFARYITHFDRHLDSKKHFKVRAENTASAIASIYNGICWVKDFGSGKSYTAIDFVMEEERLEFVEALNFIASQFGIQVSERTKVKSSYEYEPLAPAADELHGDISFEPTAFTDAVLHTIFSKNIWNRLSKINREKDGTGKLEEASDEVARRNAIELCKKYGLVNLAYQTLVVRTSDKAVKHKFIATDTYPILLWEAGTWRKIYKPKEINKKYRFLIQGQKSRVLFGLAVAEKTLQDRKDAALLECGDDEAEKAKIRSWKLDEIIICSGGSDAINVAACGYAVVWLDNEMFKLTAEDSARLFGIAHRVYYLPDIDVSGIYAAIDLGLEHLDIELVFLPKALNKEFDFRGNRCKDVRDFFNKHRSKDFDNLLHKAMPLRCWDETVKKDKGGNEMVQKGKRIMQYSPNPELLLNFLFWQGYSTYEMEGIKKETMVVLHKDNVVKEQIEFRQVYHHVKGFLGSDPVMNKVKHGHLDLINAFNKSPQFSANILEKLPVRDFDFKSYGQRHQFLFFENKYWKVMPDTIAEGKIEQCSMQVWERDIFPKKAKIEKPDFEIFEDAAGFDIKIHAADNMFLNFLIQTSRIYWQTELEDVLDRVDFTKKDAILPSGKLVGDLGVHSKDEYRQKYNFKIDNPLLTSEQVKEQKVVLISKLIAMGYLLHGYKDMAEAYCLWVTDHNSEQTTEEAQSFGGTGKTIYFHFAQLFLRTHLLDGQNRKLMEDQFMFDGVTRNTRLIYVDDAGKYLRFEEMFAVVTSFLRVNPKGMSPFILPFSVSPKLAISSNLPPKKNDPSTRRRMWFLTFSSYYHKNPKQQFREERQPKEEFGCTLFGDDFPEEQWNKSCNLAAYMCQAYLKHGKVEGIEDTIIRNMLISQMTLNFKRWADEIFHPDNGRLNTEVQRTPLQDHFNRGQQYKITPQTFMERLQAWCEFYGYILNPKHLQGKDGRIMRHVELEELNGNTIEVARIGGEPKKGTRECIYIETNGVQLEFTETMHADSDLPKTLNDSELNF